MRENVEKNAKWGDFSGNARGNAKLMIIFFGLISSGGLSRDHYWRGGIQEIHDFRSFWEYFGDFWYFFVKYLLVARAYLVVVTNIKILIMGALVALETRLKVPILDVFWRFWTFFELFVLAQAFSLGYWLFTKN